MTYAPTRASPAKAKACTVTMMASLPLTIDDDTRNLVDGLERRQKDLTDFQVPRLRQFIGSLVEQERLAAELKEDLDVFGRQVEVSV